MPVCVIGRTVWELLHAASISAMTTIAIMPSLRIIVPRNGGGTRRISVSWWEAQGRATQSWEALAIPGRRPGCRSEGQLGWNRGQRDQFKLASGSERRRRGYGQLTGLRQAEDEAGACLEAPDATAEHSSVRQGHGGGGVLGEEHRLPREEHRESVSLNHHGLSDAGRNKRPYASPLDLGGGSEALVVASSVVDEPEGQQASRRLVDEVSLVLRACRWFGPDTKLIHLSDFRCRVHQAVDSFEWLTKPFTG